MKILYITTRKLFDECEEKPFGYLAEIHEPIIHKHAEDHLIDEDAAHSDCGRSILLAKGSTAEEAKRNAIDLIESHIYSPDEEPIEFVPARAAHDYLEV